MAAGIFHMAAFEDSQRWPRWAGSGLAVTLFLIGSTLHRKALARVGVRPLLMAVVLWVVSASASLWAIRAGVIIP